MHRDVPERPVAEDGGRVKDREQGSGFAVGDGGIDMDHRASPVGDAGGGASAVTVWDRTVSTEV